MYMRYACGEWNDDMKVLAVSDTTFNHLLNTEVDPLFITGKEELSDLFYLNISEEFGFKYRLIGYLDANKSSGCEDRIPKFWIEKIEMLNGNKFKMAE
ncbi:hypothetical protein [Tenacibaculum jejuense]|nr:hypothetical protein [Tenacibaculum jejuense]